MLRYLAVYVLVCLQITISKGSYHYKVETKTGNALDAGTDVTVKIKIIGTKESTTDHELDAAGKNDFERGKHDKFSFDDDEDVGIPYKIQMYREASWPLGDWQLEWVRVIYNAKTYSFKYGAWLPKKKWTDISVSCSKGYHLASNHQCMDINECETKCKGPNSICKNKPGSYDCTCKLGYRLVNDQCLDINECAGSHGCQQKCYNLPGSYRCYCNDGYKLQGFSSCVNIDECKKNPCQENTICKDTIGSFRCDCKDGFEEKDSLSCKDVDECSTSKHQCDFKVSNCINTMGSYKCTCRQGFTRSSKFGCKDVDECKDGSNTCDNGRSTCVNTFGDYYCKCNDGYHQGKDNKVCIKDKCGALSKPYESKVSPLTCTDSDANYYGDVCTVSCNKGYELEDANVNTITCGARGKWIGTPRCQRVKCPALSDLTNGKLLPPTCTTVGNTYEGQCTYLCNRGYRRHGSPLRECQADKTWSGSKPTCIKMVAKPTVKCPSDIMVDLAPGQKAADISARWKEPTYKGGALLVHPLYANAKYQYPVGITRITWTAKNSAGSDSCSILVVVHDKEPPKVVSCPSSPVAVLTTTNSAIVTWSKPKFTDNVGVVEVSSTHTSGKTFSIGSMNVYYTASDASGNRAVCKFEVLVQQKGCPAINAPVGGATKCGNFGPTKYCQVTCQNGRKIFNNPSGFNFWTCKSAFWSPSAKIPDCVAATLNNGGSACSGNQVIMTSKKVKYCADCPTGSYSTNGICAPCSSGYYQDEQGKLSCKKCPSGFMSFSGASSIKQCRAVCRAGHYSKDGMDPGCQLCPMDTYQNQQMATTCKPCPKGTRTRSAGSTKLLHCGVKPAITKLEPKTKTIDEKTSTSITCIASGIPTPDITLKFRKVLPPEFLGKEKIDDITDSNGKKIGIKLTITGARPENSGRYDCNAVNTFGKATDVATLTVNEVLGSGGGAIMDEEELEML